MYEYEVVWSVCMSAGRDREYCKTVEPIEIPFWDSLADSRGSEKPLLDWGSYTPTGRGIL